MERPAYERSLEKRLELGHRVHVLSYNPSTVQLVAVILERLPIRKDGEPPK